MELNPTTKWTPLHLACIIGNFDVVKFYVDNGITSKWDFVKKSDFAPLMLATIHGHHQIIEYLQALSFKKGTVKSRRAARAFKKSTIPMIFFLMNFINSPIFTCR